MRKFFLVFTLVLFVSVSTNAQAGKMSITPNVTLAIPLGDFGDGANMGFGATVAFMYRVIPQLDLTGSLGYLRWGYKEFDGSFSSIPLLFGARYYFTNGTVMPYAGAELGLHFASASIKLPTYTLFGETYGGGTESSSDTDFGVGFGGGTLIQVAPNFLLDATLQFNIIARSGSSSNYLSLEVGASFGIN